MGASISSTMSVALTYCCMTAANSLCNACLGSTAEGTTGRKRSVLLLTLAIALALWLQYQVAPAIVDNQHSSSWIIKMYRWIPGMGDRVYRAWHDPCQRYHPINKNESMHVVNQCAGNAGVYRPMAMASFFFAISAIAAKVQPSLNREVWPAKYILYLFSVLVSLFLPSAPFFTGIYLWFARILATAFVLLQQVILIDMAYNWNEDWVERAEQADRFEYGSGSVWLQAIVGTCVAFYSLTLAGITILYQYFDGCPENIWIITLTLIGVIALTAIQLSGQEGSLLTSSVMSLYVTYLAYGMVSKNPRAVCNPQLGSNDAAGITIGLTLTAISLAWIGWSWTAQDRLNVQGVQSARTVTSQQQLSINGNGNTAAGEVNLDAPFLDPDSQPTSGLVMDSELMAARSARQEHAGQSDLWKLNVVLVLISCFVAMTLTGWGTVMELDNDDTQKLIDGMANAANPTVGRVNMAMIGVSQWLAILLYIWTLVAPRVFPDREFA